MFDQLQKKEEKKENNRSKNTCAEWKKELDSWIIGREHERKEKHKRRNWPCLTYVFPMVVWLWPLRARDIQVYVTERYS